MSNKAVATDFKGSDMDPDAIVEAGQKIYDREYRESYEQAYPDQFAVIDVLDGSVYRAAEAVDALRLAERSAPNGMFYLVWIGHRSAYRMSSVA